MALLTIAKLDVKYGILTITDDDNCTISSGQHVLGNIPRGTLPGLWFGIIDYKCEKTFGHVYSKFECLPCGVYCTRNQLHLSCKSVVLPVILGVIISILSFVLIYLMTRKHLNNLIKLILERMHYYKAVKSDHKRIKLITPLIENGMLSDESKIFESSLPKDNHMYQVHVNMHKKVEDIIRQPEMIENDGYFNETNIRKANSINKLMNQNIKTRTSRLSSSDEVKKNTSTNEIDKEDSRSGVKCDTDESNCRPCTSGEIKKEDVDQLHREVMSEIRTSLKKEKRNKNKFESLGLLMLGLSTLTKTDACDTTLFLSSKGKICRDNRCLDLDVTTFTIRQGDVVCFNTYDHGQIKIEVERTEDIYRYIKDYYTSDYELKADSYRRCWRAGECSWDNCESETIGQRFKMTAANNSRSIIGHGCHIVPTSCDWTCASGQICHYYRWELLAKGFRYPVYSLSEKTWSVTVRVDYNTYTFKQTLNANSPSHNILVENKSGESIKIPISIVSILKSEKTVKSNLIDIDGNMIEVNACEKNFPVYGLVGDYQISLNDEEHLFDQNNVDCSNTRCSLNCVIRDSSISRLIKTSSINRSNNTRNKYSIMDDYNVDVVKKSYSTLNLMIGNVDIKNLIIKDAKCDIIIDMSYGCLSCIDKPFLVVTPTNIKVRGSLMYYSNCSFDRALLSCTNEPYMLVMDKNYNYCLIDIPSINFTKVVEVNYEYLGGLSPIQYTAATEETSWAVAKDLVTSNEFLSSLVGSFTFFAISTIIATSIIRVFKYLSLVKLSKNIDKA